MRLCDTYLLLGFGTGIMVPVGAWPLYNCINMRTIAPGIGAIR
jgi:hypothetical protein